MALSDLGIYCLDDHNKPNIAEYSYYITEPGFKNPDMSWSSVLGLSLASRCSFPTVFKRLYCNIFGLMHLVSLARRRREPPVLTPLSLLEMLNVNMIKPLIQGFRAMAL